MTLAQLPKDIADRLIQIHASGDRTALRHYIKALRDQQWPLRAIGDPLGVSRSTIQFWDTTGNTQDDAISVPLSPKAIETAGVRTVRWRSHIREADKFRMYELGVQARQVRSQTPVSSSLRKASEELDLLIDYYLDRMVAVTEIADTIGVTHRAIKARMERYNVRH